MINIRHNSLGSHHLATTCLPGGERNQKQANQRYGCSGGERPWVKAAMSAIAARRRQQGPATVAKEEGTGIDPPVKHGRR
jgi:hypothetical protein